MSTEMKSKSKFATKIETAGEEKSKSGIESQDVILRMIGLNSSGEAKRWNAGDNILLGFINIKKLEADLKDSSINLANEPFLKQTKPKEPESLEVFKAGLVGIPLEQFKNKAEFAVLYVSGWKQFEDADYDSQAALAAIGRTNTASQSKYQNALKMQSSSVKNWR
jgi:hypothetical protein